MQKENDPLESKGLWSTGLGVEFSREWCVLYLKLNV